MCIDAGRARPASFFFASYRHVVNLWVLVYPYIMLLLKKHLVKLVRDGKKRQTLRFWTRPIVSVGQVSFTPGLGRMLITGVDVIDDMSELTDADALADGFNNLAELIAELRRIYPSIPPKGKKLYRIAFQWPIGEKPASAAPVAKTPESAHGKVKRPRRAQSQPGQSAHLHSGIDEAPKPDCAKTLPSRSNLRRRSAQLPSSAPSSRSPTAREMKQLRDWILNQREKR